MHLHTLNTQQRCRFVLWRRPKRMLFPAVNRLTDKQAIALAQRIEPYDLGLPQSAAEDRAQLRLIHCSPDKAIFQ